MTGPQTHVSAVVVGAGHNGLICAAYLARQGHDVVLLEARPTVGGLASTVSDLGARFNICNCDHTMIRANPLIEELDLGTHGLRYLEQEPSFINMSWSEDAPWIHFYDVEQTLDGLARTRPRQVDGYRRYIKAATPVADLLVEVAAVRPTTPALVKTILRRRARGARTMLRWSRLSVLDVLREYFTDESLIMPAISVGPTVWGVPPDTPTTGLAAASYALRHRVRVGRPEGGSGALTDSICQAFTTAGGQIRCNSKVSSLLIEDGTAAGVALEDGEVIRAKVIIAACDPRIVLGEWVDDEPRRARGVTAKWRNAPVTDGYESKIDAVVDMLPRYHPLDAISDQLDGLDPLEPTSIISPTLADLQDAHRLLARGEVSPKLTLLVNFPSVLDETMRTKEGHHVMSLEALFTPYALEGGWAGSNEPQRWMELWAGFVQPDYLGHVVASRAMTPDRYEAEFNMHRGHTPSFGGSPIAALLGRNRELTRYRSPVEGLLLTGAGTYPGAGIWGASGRNAASVANQKLASSGRFRS